MFQLVIVIHVNPGLAAAVGAIGAGELLAPEALEIGVDATDVGAGAEGLADSVVLLNIGEHCR